VHTLKIRILVSADGEAALFEHLANGVSQGVIESAEIGNLLVTGATMHGHNAAAARQQLECLWLIETMGGNVEIAVPVPFSALETIEIVIVATDCRGDLGRPRLDLAAVRGDDDHVAWPAEAMNVECVSRFVPAQHLEGMVLVAAHCGGPRTPTGYVPVGASVNVCPWN
jgi:hypothetical protein